MDNCPIKLPLMDRLHWRSLQSETIDDSDTQQSLLYLPWPPWAMQKEMETIPSVPLCPRWPRQVYSDCCSHRHYRITFTNVKAALPDTVLRRRARQRAPKR
jgi:hypothetical protein